MILQLRCKVCKAIQGVSVPDEADEDARTQSIRRAFRAEHLEKCGEHAVALEMVGPDAPPPEIDARAWLAEIAYPDDVTPSLNDGYFSRQITREGKSINVRVCEDCWQNIPRYADFPFGLVSPESDGDRQGQHAKRRQMVLGNTGAWQP